MDKDKFEKAKDLESRKKQLLKAISILEKAQWTKINLNGISTCDSKADVINIGSDQDQVFVSKSDDLFYKIRKSTENFLKEELEMVEREFDAL